MGARAPSISTLPDPTEWGIRGYASVFGVLDSYDEIVDQGAFERTLRERGIIRPVYFGHAIMQGPWVQPVGVTTALREDQHGLYFEASLVPGVGSAQLLWRIDSGAVPSASFSFQERGWREGDDGRRHLTDLELYEVGPVARGANPQAYTEIYQLPAHAPGRAAIVAAIDHLAHQIADVRRCK